MEVDGHPFKIKSKPIGDDWYIWERDVLIAYGVSCFLKEKMTDSSDLFRMYVSKRNQTFCIGNEKEKLFKFADKHLDPDDIKEVQLPYAMKLLFQEICSLGIDMRLKVD